LHVPGDGVDRLLPGDRYERVLAPAGAAVAVEIALADHRAGDARRAVDGIDVVFAEARGIGIVGMGLDRNQPSVADDGSRDAPMGERQVHEGPPITASPPSSAGVPRSATVAENPTRSPWCQ